MCAEDASRIERAGLRAITVNSTWQIAPWADAHYSSDADWWAASLPKMRDRCSGELWTGHPSGGLPSDIHVCPYRKGARGLYRQPGALAWGGNSGYCAIGLAYQFGARRVILLGYDQQGEHWHEDHPEPIRKPANFPMWAERFGELARDCEAVGVEVINASRETSLTCFRRATLEDALQC